MKASQGKSYSPVRCVRCNPRRSSTKSLAKKERACSGRQPETRKPQSAGQWAINVDAFRDSFGQAKVNVSLLMKLWAISEELHLFGEA